ncbi:MAG: acetate--CoA ligase family protein [Acidimicrobiaceae bacterium]|nr:acetate--CoA ligase family protein [Acidimicrobiaceae bacterium]MYG98048.1 acetate--CoA ligase family protein [Acidimicrobiaceae bacterium]MYL02650.1 acetate--CoA ligase family protein [Acidimicrobiaceae bacterium]
MSNGRVAPGLESLLDPRSVALVGASRRASRWGFLFVRGMEQGSAVRTNYYISRSVDEPETGWYPSIEALPEVPELVVLLIGDAGSRQQIELCLELGSKAVITIATPFTGRDDPLLDRIAEAGMVVLGPNTMGLVCTHTRLDLAPPLLHGEPRDPGRVAVVSQSGTVSADLALELYDRGVGLSTFLGVGDQYCLTASGAIRALADDEHSEAVVVYLEDPLDGRDFRAALEYAHQRGMAVVIMPAGDTGASARAVASHTGALATDARVLRAVCEESGAWLATSPADAVDHACVAVRRRWAAGPRVAVLSEGGGAVALAADVLGRAGLVLPGLSDRTRDRVGLRPGAKELADNPVDLALVGAVRESPMVYADTVKALAESGEVDQVLTVGQFGDLIGMNPEREDIETFEAEERQAVSAIIDTSERTGVPVLMQSFRAAPGLFEELVAGGVLVVRHLDHAAKLLRLGVADARSATGGDDGDGSRAGSRNLSYFQARDLLERYGIPLVPSTPAAGPDEVLSGEDLPAPMVVKALGRVHKSRGGGVELGLRDARAAAAAVERMQRDLGAEEFAIEPDASVPGSVELIVGARRTGRFGIVALLGVGGTHTEQIDDISLGFAPVNAATFDTMVGRLRSRDLIWRGSEPRIDLDAVQSVLESLVTLLDERREVLSAEVNPLQCTTEAVIGLDARVVCEEPES